MAVCNPIRFYCIPSHNRAHTLLFVIRANFRKGTRGKTPCCRIASMWQFERPHENIFRDLDSKQSLRPCESNITARFSSHLLPPSVWRHTTPHSRPGIREASALHTTQAHRSSDHHPGFYSRAQFYIYPTSPHNSKYRRIPKRVGSYQSTPT